MKLLTATTMDEAKDMPAHSAVLYMWDWRNSPSTSVSTSDIYVNDGQGGWKTDGYYTVVKVKAGRWQASQMNKNNELDYGLGFYPTRDKARQAALAHLADRLGDGLPLPPKADEKLITELAATIANQAEAIANGTVKGPRYAQVKLLAHNIDTLGAWVGDDR